MFVNLLENATTHGASSRGIDVVLCRGREPTTVEVEVRDRGPGIPVDLGDRIFEPRIRGAAQVSGAGLGLPIALAIVEAHGGRLSTVPVEHGAAFLVTLQAEPPGATPASAADASWTWFDEAGDHHVG